MTSQATVRVPDPGSSAPFRDAIIGYEQAAARYQHAVHATIDYRDAVMVARETVKDLEAAVMANGGVGDVQITGSNAEMRAASLRVALAGYPAYQDAMAQLRQAERSLAEAEAERDDASNDMRACRLRIEFGTSFNYRSAAVEGRPVVERNGSHVG